MTQTLPEFSEYSVCQKCGYAHAPPSPPKTKYDKKANNLIRTCLNCGFEWRELPADTSPPPAAKPRSRWKQIEVNDKKPP